MDKTQHEKAGYLDVKFPPKSRGLKVKPWKKRWVVVHEVSDLAAKKTLAKLDIYLDKASVGAPHSEKTTIILENITAIRRTKSKTHPYAFQIVDTDVVLSLSGKCESDTQSWMIIFRKIFWPEINPVPEGTFEVSVIDSRDSNKIQMSGNYWFHASPVAVTLLDATTAQIKLSWPLSSLRRFYIATTPDDGDLNHILVIQAGAVANTGEGEYMFYSERARDILVRIRDSIQEALANRQSHEPHFHATKPRSRAVSTTSSVLHYKGLLESHDRTNVETGLSQPTTPDSVESLSFPGQMSPTRSGSLPLNIAYLRKDKASYSPPSYVLERKPRCQTLSETSDHPQLDLSIRHSRSVETFSRTVSNQSTTSEGGRSQLSIQLDNAIPDKSRTVSMSSNHSRASGSFTSRDSGIIFTAEQYQIEEENEGCSIVRNSSYSFDSAVSTSEPCEDRPVTPCKSETSQTDTSASSIQASLDEKDYETASENTITESTQEKKTKRISVTSNVYAVIPSRKTSTVSNEYAAIPADLRDSPPPPPARLRRSLSFDRCMRENDYEELDSFRKDLQKYLDFNPKIDKKDEPPALPERPSSTKVVRRKTKTPRHVRASKVASMFVRPSRKQSGSSSDDDEVNALISQVNNWERFEKRTENFDSLSLNDSCLDVADICFDTHNITEKDGRIPSPPFDMISPPPISSRVNYFGSSAAKLSPDLLKPEPVRDLLEWSPVSRRPLPEIPLKTTELLIDLDSNEKSNRRSSTKSCPCSDERCTNVFEEDETSHECSRSFSEVSEHLSDYHLTKIEPEESTDVYECMSEPDSQAPVVDLLDDWADFDTVFGSHKSQNTTDAGESDFDSLFPFDDLTSMEKDNTFSQNSVGRLETKPLGEKTQSVGDLIDLSIPVTSVDATYFDMSNSKPLV